MSQVVRTRPILSRSPWEDQVCEVPGYARAARLSLVWFGFVFVVLVFRSVSLSCVWDDAFWFYFVRACTILFLGLGVVSELLHVYVLVAPLGGRALSGRGGRVGAPLLSVRSLFPISYSVAVTFRCSSDVDRVHACI